MSPQQVGAIRDELAMQTEEKKVQHLCSWLIIKITLLW
jgi:hypothetical protein